MKKLLLVCAIGLFAGINTASAQEGDGTAYSQGQSTVSLGYGFGNIWKKLFKITSAFSGGSYKTSSTGPYSITYEYGVTDKISVGLAVAYSQIKGVYTDPSDPDENYTDKLTNTSAILRGNYHFGSSAKFDPYIGLGLGYYNFKYETKYKDGTNTGNVFAIPGSFGFNGQLGAKYYITDQFGLFAEVGYVVGGIGQIGVNFKF